MKEWNGEKIFSRRLWRLFVSRLSIPDSALIDTLRLSPREVETLLDKLNSRRDRLDGASKRRHPRVFFTQIQGVPMTVSHPGGSSETYLVLPHDLSISGMCVLHGGFLHTSSRVEIVLNDVEGFSHKIAGQVVRCSHFQKKIHEIGIRFDEMITLSRFSKDATAQDEEENLASRRLAGNVLYIEDSTDFRDLMRFHLTRLGVEAVVTDKGGDGVRLARDLELDAIVVDVHLPDMSGVEVIEQINAAGNKLAIIVITGDEAQETQERCLEAGASMVVHKPLSPNEVWDVFAPLLPSEAPEGCEQDVIYSQYWSDQAMRPVIIGFLERLSVTTEQLGDAVENTEDPSALPALAHDLRTSAAGYGFPQITQAIDRLLRENEVGKKRVAVREVKRLCSLASAGLEVRDAA